MADEKQPASWPTRVRQSLTQWLKIGYRDWPCPRCGTIVRAGQRQCVLCGHDFSTGE